MLDRMPHLEVLTISVKDPHELSYTVPVENNFDVELVAHSCLRAVHFRLAYQDATTGYTDHTSRAAVIESQLPMAKEKGLLSILFTVPEIHDDAQQG